MDLMVEILQAYLTLLRLLLKASIKGVRKEVIPDLGGKLVHVSRDLATLTDEISPGDPLCMDLEDFMDKNELLSCTYRSEAKQRYLNLKWLDQFTKKKTNVYDRLDVEVGVQNPGLMVDERPPMFDFKVVREVERFSASSRLVVSRSSDTYDVKRKKRRQDGHRDRR